MHNQSDVSQALDSQALERGEGFIKSNTQQDATIKALKPSLVNRYLTLIETLLVDPSRAWAMK